MAIINLGSINIDHVYQVPHFVKPGETLASTHYQQLLGGKGANQSLALAKAGAEVHHVGCIHRNDAIFKQTLIKQGVDCRFLRCADTPSGHAIIQVTPTGENAIVLFGGANQTVEAAHIEAALEQASPSDWVLTQNETSAIAELFTRSREKGVKVAFNPAPMTAAVKQLPLDCLDLLIVNETEAEAITGCTALPQMEAYFRQQHPDCDVIITLGKAGVVMLKGEQRIAVPAFNVDAVDTTAAGDTFIGYFLAAYSDHADARQALLRGCAAAAIAVTREGAAPSIPDITEVDRFLAKHADTQ